MSVENIITENLDIWTSAIKTKSASGRGSSSKTELFGIKKLRELILDLAIRGKLVPQEPDEKTAQDVLCEVREAKLKLYEEGRLKSAELPPEITIDEFPFQLPTQWEWCRFSYLLDFSGGGQPPKTFFSEVKHDGYVQLIQIRDLGPKPQPVYIPKDKASKFCTSDDIMVGRYGASVGKVFWGKDGAYNVALVKIDNDYKAYIPSFVHLLLSSPLGQSFFGGISRSAQDGFNKNDIAPKLIPVLSREEQKRIVTKVDELMSFCDQLESQTEASIEAHQTLVKSLLESLTNAKDADELIESWQRISAHFDVLFTTEDSIDQLKQTILQLAVMGKLVKQDPNDEPASKLLERIEAEKVQLIKDKKIKKQTKLEEVNESDFPFSTPEGWAVVRLGALIPQFQNGASSRGDKKGKETIVLRLADIKDWRISENDTRRLIINEETIEKYLLKKGDTLIIRVNGSSEIVGRFITVEKVTDAIYCDHFIRMRFPIPCIEPNYLAILGSSRLVRDKISDLFISTAGQKTVNQTHISSLTLSIPPIMEQKRISERVRYLVAICDELKSKLQTVQRTIGNVADSVKANY